MTRLLPIAALALLAGAAQPLAAQIATGVTPPPPAPTPAQMAAADSARQSARDSVVMAERMGMRAWVDSAARSLEQGGAPVSPLAPVTGDSLAPSPSAGTPAAQPARDSARAAAPARPVGAPGPTFREGAPAPDTATPLPLLLLLGGSAAAAGVGLLRRR